MPTELEKLRDTGTLDAAAASRLALEAAELIIDHDRNNKEYLRDKVALICEIAADKDPAIARAGVQALFPALIERLNDSFDPQLCSLYDRVFSQVIEYFRRLPDGKKLDQGLRSFGLINEEDLLTRKSQISNLKSQTSNLKPQISNLKSQISKVLFLSRVTIGADVAVTSVIIARLREIIPDAEFVLLGSRKLRELFGGDPLLRIREIAYERGGGVLSRLTAWLDIVEIIEDECRGHQPHEIWLIDPDSRLTQLGLLPLLRDETNYFFFESRSHQRPGAGHLGELASDWVNQVFNTTGRAFPYLALPTEHRAFGQALGAKLRRSGASRLISMSLGVGGNPNKRISDSFEEDLVLNLVQESTLILDKGTSREEMEQIDRITTILRSRGKTVVEVDQHNAPELLKREGIRADVLTWQGGIGAFAGLIAAGDEYIGYDSAGQHIAAALGVPTLTIFVNANSPTFAERWRPSGSGRIEVLNIDAAHRPQDENQILSRLLSLHRRLR
jgi:ADP-heptose:LPS heptosyltransferase